MTKHFMKTFKQHYGVSPTEYRRNAQLGEARRQAATGTLDTPSLK